MTHKTLPKMKALSTTFFLFQAANILYLGPDCLCLLQKKAAYYLRLELVISEKS